MSTCCRTIIWVALGAFLILFVQMLVDDKNVAKFSVDLTGIEGLNATVGRAASPVFNVTAKVENRRALMAWNSTGGQAVLSYAGVSLAWGRVPGFCAPRKGVAELVVAAKGRSVGLSDDLRRRFVAEWNAGTARVVAEIWLFYDGNGWPGLRAHDGLSLVERKLTLPGQGAT